MKANDCKSIRQQIAELELGSEPNISILGHVQHCQPCRRLLEDESNLRRLVASLAPVEAPPDFDFRLRARLASERAGTRRFQRIGKLSYALPAITVAAVALLAIGMVLFPRLKPVGEQSSVPAEKRVQQLPAEAKTHSQEQPSVQSVVNSKELIADNPSMTKPSNLQRKREMLGSDRPRRIAIVDSAVSAATVLKQDELSIEPQSQLIFPIQTLKVSVDDGGGVSRTISLPTVSFGSGRVFTNARAGLPQPTKVNW